MEPKHVILAVINTYISQLHYLGSCICESKNGQFSKELQEILNLADKFKHKLESEYESQK